MSNQHDSNFKQLMAERSFFEPFIKTYLPKEIVDRIDWDSMQLYKMGGKHREKKTQREFESDVIYLANLEHQDAFIWLHSEHQASPDRLMPLRIINYQAAELLSYAKQNPGKGLPGIVTLIYHQGERPWPHCIDFQDLFQEPEFAIKYFGKPILVDLPAISDQALRAHQNIGPVEMILKHIRQKDFEQKMRLILSELCTVNDSSREIVLRYVIEVADVPERQLLETAIECLPKDKEAIMTVGEQLIARGVQQGIYEGERNKACDFARKLILKGLSLDEISELTELSLMEIRQIERSLIH